MAMLPSERTSRPISACQGCGADGLKSVLFLGYIPLVNTLFPVGEVSVEQTTYPLELLRCTECTLVQIGLEVDPQVLFPPDYPYRSGTTRILRDNFSDLCAECHDLLGLEGDDLVIDIGSNDGTLLENFKDHGRRVLGIEPSRAGEEANIRGIPTHIGFFGPELAAKVKSEQGPARLVTATNVFAHVGDIHGVVEAICGFLAPDGVFLSESHYLLDLVETLQYDTIYHEHLRYYSVGSLQHLLAGHGLEVFRVKRIPTHGGSIRVYAARRGERRVMPTVESCLKLEEEAGLGDGTALKAFRERAIRSKVNLYALLASLKRDGARIYGIGAPSRASTLVNYTGLDDGMIECVMEVSDSPKVGKYLPGTRIAVLDETKLCADQPDYALLLSWHIAPELMANLRRRGYHGKFITPLPEPAIVDS